MGINNLWANPLRKKRRVKTNEQGWVNLNERQGMSVFALINACRKWTEKKYSMMKHRKECGLKRFWKRLKAENRNKVIIFIGNVYGIMDIAECMVLLGVQVKEFENTEATKAEVLKRYGIQPSAQRPMG
jgi:hypothetical protein